MAETSNIERIHDYLRQYHTQYELPTLRAQLVGAGYSATEVDAAIAALDRATSGAPSAPTQTAPEGLHDIERERVVAQMVAYLQQHGATYDLDALRRQLLQAGQPTDAVEEAVRRAALPPRQTKHDGQAWPGGLLVALLNLTLLPALAAGLVALVGNDTAVAVFSLVPSLVLLVELVIGLMVVRRGPHYRLGRMLLWGVLFSLIVPFFLFLAFVLLVLLMAIGFLMTTGSTSP